VVEHILQDDAAALRGSQLLKDLGRHRRAGDWRCLWQVVGKHVYSSFGVT
jgi:hypothetical protein